LLGKDIKESSLKPKNRYVLTKLTKMIYKNYQRNHVIIPGREKALEDFLKQDYKGLHHKWKNGISSHSEDALTWTCFEILSSFSLNKKHDQIARKLRVGLDCSENKDFYFIFLDIAPEKILMQRKSKKEASSLKKNGFYDKWKSAWWFNYYKHGRNNSLKPLKDCLEGIKINSEKSIANKMGWLTWSDLYKNILRGLIN
jgi:hypothetical protein